MVIVTVMALGVSYTDAMAQRDAGAKARGEVGTGFWNPMYRPSRNRTFFYQPTRPSGESYRSFSYQPMNISAGDHVVVTGNNAKVMKGRDVVGDVPNGMKFEVTKVIDGWLGAVVDVDGKKLNGWIWNGNVTAEDQLNRPADTARREEPSQSTRRFSYEPTLVTPSTRSVERAGRRGYSPENRLHPGARGLR
jgi:hypothetical protein